MVEQVGTVVAVNDDIATVSFMRASACEGCHKQAEGCAACSLLGGNRRHNARARNPIGACAGDCVRVATSEGRVVAYAALVFLFPILLAFGGYAIGTMAWGTVGYAAGLCAAAGFLLAMMLLMFVSHWMAKRPPDAEIVAVINNKEGDVTV